MEALNVGCVCVCVFPTWALPVGVSLSFFLLNGIHRASVFVKKEVMAIQAVFYSMPLVAGTALSIYSYCTSINLYVLLVNCLISLCD